MTWLDKHGYGYALLRLTVDPRPDWIRNLGMHDNTTPPPLKFSRKYRSHVAPPKSGEYLEHEEARYDKYLRELLAAHKER